MLDYHADFNRRKFSHSETLSSDGPSNKYILPQAKATKDGKNHKVDRILTTIVIEVYFTDIECPGSNNHGIKSPQVQMSFHSLGTFKTVLQAFS